MLEHFRSVLGREVVLGSGDAFQMGLWREVSTGRMWNVTVGLCDSAARCELVMLSRERDVPRLAGLVEELAERRDLRRGLVVPLDGPIWPKTTPTALYLGACHRVPGLQFSKERVDVHWVVPILASEHEAGAEALERLVANPKIDFTNLKRAAVTKR